MNITINDMGKIDLTYTVKSFSDIAFAGTVNRTKWQPVLQQKS